MMGDVLWRADRFAKAAEAALNKLDFQARYMGYLPDATLLPPVFTITAPGTVVTTIETENWARLNDYPPSDPECD